MKTIMMCLGLGFIFAGSIFLFGKEGEQAPAQTAQETKTECDVKNVKSFFYCEVCGKPLKGFNCPICGKGKCNWCKEQLKKISSMVPVLKPNEIERQDTKDARMVEQKLLAEHPKKYYEIAQLNGFKCPCCGTPLKSLEEVDLVANNKCTICQSPKLIRKDYCVKYIYGCPDGHKGVLLPSEYSNTCPELVDDAKGKKKECKKPLDKLEVSFEPILYKYVCAACNEVSDKPGKCSKCSKDLAKVKTCAKSGTFPHVDGKEWEKEQKAKRAEIKKNEPAK